MELGAKVTVIVEVNAPEHTTITGGLRLPENSLQQINSINMAL